MLSFLFFLFQKELVLYPNKNGSVGDLLTEAKKQVELSESGSGKLRYCWNDPAIWRPEVSIFGVPVPCWHVCVYLCFARLLEIISYKIFALQKEDVSLDFLNSPGTKTYRVEEIPKDEMYLEKDELLVPVAHFHKVGLQLCPPDLYGMNYGAWGSRKQSKPTDKLKDEGEVCADAWGVLQEAFSTFGIPFLLKVKPGDTVAALRERIQKKLDVLDKEFEKVPLLSHLHSILGIH